MAVSKVHPVEALLEAHAAGQRLFGENRVQEFAGKSDALHESLSPGTADAEVHLIGPLQSNKTTRAAELFQSVDTVDSLKTAQRLSSAATACGKQLPILIEVKLSPEDTKHGVAPALLAELLDGIAPLPSIELRGLMTVPPWSTEAETPPSAGSASACASDADRAVYRHVERLRRRDRGGLNHRAHWNGHLWPASAPCGHSLDARARRCSDVCAHLSRSRLIYKDTPYG